MGMEESASLVVFASFFRTASAARLASDVLCIDWVAPNDKAELLAKLPWMCRFALLFATPYK